MYWKHWSDGYICLGPQSSCQVQKVWRQKNITALKHLTAVKCLQPLINNHTKERQCDQKQSPHIETCTTMLPRLYLQYYCNTDFLTSSSILNTTEQTICLLLMPFETQVNRWHQLRKWTSHRGGGGSWSDPQVSCSAQLSTCLQHFNIKSIVRTCLLVKNNLRSIKWNDNK